MSAKTAELPYSKIDDNTPLTLDKLNKMKINELFKEMLIVRVGLYGHPIYIKTVQYMMDDPEAINIFTPEEILEYKAKIGYELQVHILHDIDKCFEFNIKSVYNITELSIIANYIYNNMNVYSEIINILFKTIEHYYGRGKIQLNLDNPEDFINKVINEMASYNYNSFVIRNQIKTIKMMNLMIKNIIKVIENHVVMALPQKYRDLIQSTKYDRIKLIKNQASKENFGTNNLVELKSKFKERNKKAYNTIMDMINGLSNDCSDTRSLFLFLYQEKSSNMEYPTFQQIYELKKTDLERFVKANDHDIVNCVLNLEKSIMYFNLIVGIVEIYHTNTRLRQIIASKEQTKK